MRGWSAARTLAAVLTSAALVASLGCRKAGHDQGGEPEPLDTRATDSQRDVGEKPQQVMDELGIGPGSRVADVVAGGGYYTYLLSDRVGAQGRVYATEAAGVKRRMEEGDLKGRTNIEVVESLDDVPAGTLDAVLINRAYHLIQDPEKNLFPAVEKTLKPGGKLGVIEVRLGQPTGHDMKTHRMGEETVRDEIQGGGFHLVTSSDLLANPDDPHTDFMQGKRYLADRMFLVFEKPEQTAGR